MRRFRFSIGSLLMIVLFAGVAFGALRNATEVWDSGLFSLALGVLVAAVLLAVHRAGPRRAFWVGFALVGGVYLAASLCSAIEPRLVTTRLLGFADAKVAQHTNGTSVTWLALKSINSSNSDWSGTMATNGRILAPARTNVRLWDATTGQPIGGFERNSESFIRIGHTLIALILAFAGGHASRLLFLARTSRREEPAPSPADEPRS